MTTPTVQKELPETPEHFVTAIGIMMERDEYGVIVSDDGYKKAVEYAKSWREEARQNERNKVLEEVEKLREPIDNSQKDIAGVYYEGWKRYNQALDDVLAQLKDL